MKKLLLLGIFWVLVPALLHGAAAKNYEIGRIYRNGKITVVDVTYWEWTSKTITVTYQVSTPKSVFKEALAKDPTLVLSADIMTAVQSKNVKDTTEIKYTESIPYTYWEKKAVIQKERITYQEDVPETKIHEMLTGRLAGLLPGTEVLK